MQLRTSSVSAFRDPEAWRGPFRWTFAANNHRFGMDTLCLVQLFLFVRVILWTSIHRELESFLLECCAHQSSIFAEFPENLRLFLRQVYHREITVVVDVRYIIMWTPYSLGPQTSEWTLWRWVPSKVRVNLSQRSMIYNERDFFFRSR